MYGYAWVVAVFGGATIPTQVIFPTGTVAVGGWVDHVGGTTDMHSPLADENPATWIQSPANPVAATVKLGLTDIITPPAGDILFEIDAEQV
jgi:hypothetical protein